METLDVTALEPRLKHPTIFQKYDALEVGEAFIIHNDHDPKPLYYQLIAERGENFEWDYMGEGPEFWLVQITKIAASEKSKSIGELVAEDYRKAEVFRQFGIDFCCGGKRSVEDACRKKGIDVSSVKTALKAVEQDTNSNTEDYASWDIGFLADYIVNKHHAYVTNSHPMLYELSEKVARVHGDRHPELIEIAAYFNEVAQELRTHMHKEEMILFPYIKELAAAKKNGTTVLRPGFGTIQNPINMMEAEHESAGGNLEAIRNLSNDYIPPVDACNSYRVLFAKLHEYERDLHQHIHLENNILFPKAIEFEKELLA